jgi:hypothetical protein
VITPAAERLLICSRCTSRWRFHQLACPWCLNADRAKITSFATRDGLYRLNGCDVCQRYIKAFDGRNATRQVMPLVDTLATLPLDAAAVQRAIGKQDWREAPARAVTETGNWKPVATSAPGLEELRRLGVEPAEKVAFSRSGRCSTSHRARRRRPGCPGEAKRVARQ